MGAPIAFALGAAALGGATAYQGHKAAQQQKKALRSQEQAQQRAQARAQAQSRRAEEDYNRANRRQPDLSSLLGSEQDLSRTGPASTLLTGATRIDPKRMGRTSLLGG